MTDITQFPIPTRTFNLNDFNAKYSETLVARDEAQAAQQAAEEAVAALPVSSTFADFAAFEAAVLGGALDELADGAVVSVAGILYLKDATATGETPAGWIATSKLAETFANKTFALGGNTVSGTAAEFSAAVTDANVAFSVDGRAALVSYWADGKLPDGTIVSDGTVSYVAETGATAIDDLAGLVPYGDVYPDHFDENTTPSITDMTAAIKSAVAYSEVWKLKGTDYLVEGKGIQIPIGHTHLKVSGEGMGKSRIVWTGDDGVSDGVTSNLWYFSLPVSPLEKVIFSDLSIIGSHEANRSLVTSYPLLVSNAKFFAAERVEVAYSRIMGIAARSCDFARADDCYIHHIARDGINYANCLRTSFIGNRIEYCDDDAIASHNQVFEACRGCVVSGNNVFMSQGIVILGAQFASITNNALQYVFHRAINVDTEPADGTAEEGVNAAIGVIIANNTISDLIDRTFLDGLNNGVTGIGLSGESAQSGTETYVPGWSGTSPYNYFQNAEGVNAAGAVNLPIPVSGSMVITGNVIKRTMPLTGLFSTLGLGKFYLRGGEFDYDMSSVDISYGFRVFGGYLRNVLFSNNSVEGVDRGVAIPPAAVLSDFVIKNSYIGDVRSFGFVILAAASSFEYDVKIQSITFDGDPHYRNANRSTDGTWAAAGNLTAMLLQGATGFEISGCDFKNWSRISDTSIPGVANLGAISFYGNTLYGDPSATGFSTLNAGIGDIPANLPDMAYTHIECDQASSDFGKIYRRARAYRSTAAAITSGTYVAGETVLVATPLVQGAASSQYILTGWKRLTTGSAHVAGIDWAEMRVVTGT